MNVLLTLFLLLTVGYITSHFAAERGRDRAIWFVLGIAFGLFALLALFLLPSLKEKEIAVENSSPQPEVIAPAEWHYIDVNGRQAGPVTFEELAFVRQDGLINSESYVWRHGMIDWERVKNVEQLKQLDKFGNE